MRKRARGCHLPENAGDPAKCGRCWRPPGVCNVQLTRDRTQHNKIPEPHSGRTKPPQRHAFGEPALSFKTQGLRVNYVMSGQSRWTGGQGTCTLAPALSPTANGTLVMQLTSADLIFLFSQIRVLDKMMPLFVLGAQSQLPRKSLYTLPRIDKYHHLKTRRSHVKGLFSGKNL